MIEIFFSMGWADPSVWRREVQGFNRQNQGQIRVIYRNFAPDRYLNELRRMFERRGPRIDAIAGDVIWPAEFASKGWIVDLSGRFPPPERQQFLPATIQANTYQGRVWGVPLFTDVGLLFYRKDLLNQSGFSSSPQTWDELKQMALQVKQNSGIQHGYVFPGAESECGVYNGLEYIWTHDGEVVDDYLNPTRVTIDSPQTVAGLTTERSMITAGVSPQGVDSYGVFTSWFEFFEGRSVFWRGWPGFYSEFLGPRPPLGPQQVDVAPIPAGVDGESSGCSGGFNLFINAASDAARQDAAWRFIQYLTSDDVQQERAVNNVLLPTRAAVYQRPEVRQVPIIPTARAALDNARARPTHRYYSDMSAVMAEQFNLCLKGQVTPIQATRTLQTELDRNLRRP